MDFLELKPLTANLLPAAIALDQLCFGGLWTLDGYQRELDSPNSELLILQRGSGEGGRQNSELRIQNSEFSSQFPALDPQPLDPNPLHPSPLIPHPSILGLGCFWEILEEAHITILAVHPDYQRQGLGQALLYALLVKAQQRRLEWATLEVRMSNQQAIALYQKFGFQDVGKRRKYYQDTGEDALILWLNGLQKPEFHENLRIWDQEIRDRLSRSGWHLLRNSS